MTKRTSGMDRLPQAAVDREVALSHLSPAKSRDDDRAARAKAVRNIWPQRLAHRSCNRRRISRIAPERVGRIEIVDEGGDPRDDDRRSARHRLEHAQTKAFLDRSEDQRRGQAVEPGHVSVGHRAEQRNGRCSFPELCQFEAESSLVGMMIEQARASRNDEARGGVGAMNLDKSLKDADRVLARLDAADREKHWT